MTSNEDTSIKIAWTEPAFNGGSPIFGFKINIKQKDGTFSEDLTHCDGADQSTKANLFCLIPMETLRTGSFLLEKGSTLIATVQSFNIIGYSDVSPENTSGADIRTEPDAPSNLPQRIDALTTDTSITIEVANFDTAPENGGSPIISLSVWWDQGVSIWVPISGDSPDFSLETQHTVYMLAPAGSYRFKYRAINIFGEGPFSSEQEIIAATAPDQSEPATTVV